MFERDSEFFRMSRSAAESFLQSAVIVDDRASLGLNWTEKQPKKLETPGRFRSRSTATSDREAIADGRRAIPKDSDFARRFDAKTVVDSFAQKSIVCSVLRPEKEELENLTETLEKLACCADIIVIDWALYDKGEKALEMIERIVNSSSTEYPARLSLIVIYTVEPGIVGISEQVKAVLSRMSDERGSTLEERDGGFTLILGATQVVVLAKPETSLPKEYQDRIVSFEDLADRVTEEFTRMTAGLASNVVLRSLAQVRRNTHKILSQFSSDLDAPYLTHRALQAFPKDAEEFITRLVAEELQAILEEARVGNEASLQSIKAWLREKEATGKRFTLKWNSGRNVEDIAVEALLDLLGQGWDRWVYRERAGIPKKGHKLPLTEMFCDESVFLDERFAFVTTMRTYYEKQVPQLTLGTILKSEAEGVSYWICIQPRCDCVRLESARAFPFLPLREAQDGHFQIVLREGNDYLRLYPSESAYDLEMIKFKPRLQDNGIIVARKREGLYYFMNTSRRWYKWVGELRRDHAQRLSNRFASELSRVGLDESEWLRRWAGEE